jgi:hypothetical protein
MMIILQICLRDAGLFNPLTIWRKTLKGRRMYYKVQ